IILFQRKYLHAKDLNDALIDMHQNKRFGKLVFYLEACESVKEREKMRVNMHVVSDRDVPVYMLQANIKNANNDADRQRYTEELKSLLNERQSVDKHMTDYVNSIQHLLTVDSNAILNTKQELNNRECYRKFVDNSHDNCFNMNQNPYVLGKLYIFVNICEEMRESSDADINAVNQLLIQYCQQNVDNKYSQIIE
ncbi:unnamed protein product, partial [Medioppia subpectinata]